MTATDELRRLLDERGVEHYDGTERTLWGYEQTGEGTGVYRFAASEINGGFLQFDMFRISPEQAIAATLGNDGVERSRNGVAERGTCRMERADWDDGTCTWGCACSACGSKFEHETGGFWNFCPKCGEEIVK